MNRVVYKYPFPHAGIGECAVPQGAQLLHVDAQASGFFLWAFVDPTQVSETRTVLLVGTGHPLPADFTGRHINTFMVDDGRFVFHAFEAVTS